MNATTEHEHDWRMVEAGYTRVWSVDVDSDGRVTPGDDLITGDGNGRIYLECDCGTTRDVEYGSINWLGF